MEGRDIQNAVLVKRSRKTLSKTLYLNLCNNHFSYISDLALYSRSNKCGKCGKLWSTKYECERHQKLCDDNVKRKYPGNTFRYSMT